MNKKQIPEVDYTKLEWTCTDPDNEQYGRKVSDGVFQFKEWIGGAIAEKTIEELFDEPGSWEEDTIILANFNENEIREHISAYYSSLEELKEIYGDDSDWIIAECIFEQQSGLY
jgi:hypothetical protein